LVAESAAAKVSSESVSKEMPDIDRTQYLFGLAGQVVPPVI
jgi:hypothetical protein